MPESARPAHLQGTSAPCGQESPGDWRGAVPLAPFQWQPWPRRSQRVCLRMSLRPRLTGGTGPAAAKAAPAKHHLPAQVPRQEHGEAI